MIIPKTLKVFTLIELLCILATISFLVSILVPVLDMAHSTMEKISCTDNQRGFAIGAMKYSEDHNGFYPSYKQLGSGDLLAGKMIYLEYAASEIFFCPTETERLPKIAGLEYNVKINDLDSPTFYFLSYGTNFRFVTGGPGSRVAAKYNQINSPSTTVFQTDTFEGPNLNNSGYALLYPAASSFRSSRGYLKACHQEGVNTLWCDGRVSWKSILYPESPYSGEFSNGWNPQSSPSASLWDRN